MTTRRGEDPVPEVPSDLTSPQEAFCAPGERFCDYIGRCSRPEHYRCPEPAYTGPKKLDDGVRRALGECSRLYGNASARESCRWGVVYGATRTRALPGAVVCAASRFPAAFAAGNTLGQALGRDPFTSV